MSKETKLEWEISTTETAEALIIVLVFVSICMSVLILSILSYGSPDIWDGLIKTLNK